MKLICVSVVAVGVLLSALVATGCGTSASEVSSSSAPTRDHFIEHADSICEQAEAEQLQLIVAYRKKHPTASELEEVEPAAIPPLEKQIESISGLTPPEGDEGKVQAWIEAFEAGLQKARENPRSILDLRNNPFGGANKEAAKYGFASCSNAP